MCISIILGVGVEQVMCPVLFQLIAKFSMGLVQPADCIFNLNLEDIALGCSM